MSDNLIEFNNISKFFGKVIALKDVTMKLKKGEIMCLLGDNGAGKSTLIKTLAGVHKPDEGEIIIEGKKIIHMIINGYKINDEYYSFLPKEINAKNISLDIKFICLSKSLIRNLEQSLKKLQISIEQLLCAKYVKNYSEKNNLDFFDMANKIILGHNKNEVKIVNKKIKNKGFFEKFFDFFN